MSKRPAERGSPRRAPALTLPRCFEERAAADPRRPLLVYGEWRLSYRDVNVAANRLAHRLLSLGVGRNVRVGLALERGPDLLVAILAVLKAGGAWVPLDPHWPAERLRRMQRLASPAVFVTRTAFLGALPGGGASGTERVIDLDRDQAAIAAGSSENPDVRIDPSQWCYVLFTSGSTGVPKGVPVTHANLAGLFPPLTAALGLGPDDVWTWFHSASFGFSVWELWGALLHGGGIVIVPEHIRTDPAALGQLIADEGVTVFSQTPSAYRRVLADARFHATIAQSRLRYLALSGEAIRRDDIAGWLARRHPARLINTYAITETAGQIALRVYGEGDATEEGARNLGRPLAGRSVLVLDGDGLPVTAGTAGELWVGGDCVTPGYLGAADGAGGDGELAVPFSELAVPGTGILRGYRTGDRVRQLADGSLEYLGRTDSQLKFRGHRIEPGDIETALRQHPAVRDAAVGLRLDRAGNQRLTAWVVSGEAPPLSPAPAGAAEFWPSLGAHGIYDQWLYGLMNAEPVRLAAYRAAFAAAVPGKVVLDVGTGEDAVLARLCIEAGAAHVYAVEVLEGPARRAAELVRSLRLEERITVLQGDIADLDLPGPVDVCTQGIIGNIGSADGIAPIWNAARRHFAPGCVPVPERCVTRIAALELPAAVRANPRFGPLAADYARRLVAAAGGPFDFRLCLRNIADGDLLTAPAEFEQLDFRGELATTGEGRAELSITRDGYLDGCLLWTVVTATAGHAVDYFREQRAWLPVYLPLADEPLPVRRGDRLELEWRCGPSSHPVYPDYELEARLAGSEGSVLLRHVSRHQPAGTADRAGTTRLHRELLAQLDLAGAGALQERLSVTELRRWLEQRVPEHLVPQSWVFLPELPLGPGGKLDREALPAPDAARPRLAGPLVAPRSPAEQALSDLWTEVLGLDALGVEDDFFELGGDSITAVQLTTRLQRWLDAGVPLAALFEAPSIAGLARHLERHFAGPLAAAVARTPVAVPATDPVAAGSQRSPLTFSQQSLWFLHHLYPGDTGASEQFAIRLRGPLNRLALERAWRRVLRRHPVLASRFVTEGEQVFQVDAQAEKGTFLISTAESEVLPVSPVEMRDVPFFLPSALAEAELRRPFDLARGPLVRAVLCPLSADTHLLLVTAHHIVADGLSVPVIQKDLARYYTDAGEEDLAPTLGYRMLAREPAWQQGLATPEALDWWRGRLDGLPPSPLRELVSAPTAVPLSRRVLFTLDAELADALRRFARAGQATPYMVLLAGFRILIARLTGQADFCIGTPMTLRDTGELAEVVGCLVNPVALRLTVDPGRSFREQLKAERAAALEAFQYRTVPFSRVVEAVAPRREFGVHPLFQILFSWEPSLPAIATADGLELDVVPVPAARSSYFDLECSLRDAGEGGALSGYIAWSTRALEDWVAEELPARLRTLLDDAISRPDTPLSQLALLRPDERRRLLVEWNATAAPLPAERTLHEAFLARSARTPGAVALRTADQTLTYGELAAGSAALAAELGRHGVRDGRTVGIALPRSADMVLAVLATLRAGGIVVPLDPGFPVARLRFMASDAALSLLIVNRETGPLAAQLGDFGGGILDISTVGAASAATDATSPTVGLVAPEGAPTAAPAATTGEAPAMMLYTSGSTGQPKAALTTHQSAVNRCDWMWRHFGFGPDEVFALRTSLGFIDAWWEIFGALAHGVPLQIVPDEIATDPLRLPGFVAATGITQLVLVPSLLRALLEQWSGTGSAPAALRWCITSGEPLMPGLVARCRELLPRTTLINTYGTSEIWDATAFDTRGLPEDARRVPIGRPVANARVYVVDGAGQPLPPGFAGELLVAGLGAGPGYWRRAALTAEKFGGFTLAEVAEERVYRTGDRARFLADGSLECLGRLDAQVKLRGQRIEPGEIEQALLAHPAVAGAVVGVAGEGDGALLVAGVVRAPDPPPGDGAPGATSGMDGAALARALRLHLKDRLPAWMVPAEWRELPVLPLTPTGKLDRRRWLGDGTELLATGPGAPLAPRTETEERLSRIWNSLLGRKAGGVRDNFFEQGGHSLLAARLLTRIRAAFGVSLTLRALFTAPTVAGLAALLDAELHGARRRDAAPAEPAGLQPDEPGSDRAPLSFGQERLWFLEQLDPGSPAYNVAWTIRCTGPLDVAALALALDAVVARHPALRTRFPDHAGRPVAVTEAPAPVDLRVLPRSGCSPGELEAEFRRLGREPFDLARGPLFRATLLSTGAREHHLLLVAQHIVTDATSNHVLFADLAAALAAAAPVAGPALVPDWPALPVSYGDFARRQRDGVDSPRLLASRDWWRQQLAGAPPALELPADRPRPVEQRFEGAWIRRPVPAPVVTGLQALARQQGCTPYMVLLAAFKALLHRYTGAVDLLVGSPVEGRQSAEVELVVGLFINTLVMRTDLSGDPAFVTLLGRVRETTLDAQAHQEIPFEQLVEALAPERSLSRSPVFQVMFNLVRLPERRRRLGDLELCVDRLVDLGVSSFDLTLTAAIASGPEDAESLALTFEYATDLFDTATIEQLADCYLTLLAAALRDPAQPLSRLPLLDAAARERVLAPGLAAVPAAGPPAREGVPAALVHHTVADAARRTPDEVAVVLDGATLTYGGLDTSANRLARHLRAGGLRPGDRVGICLPRGPDYLAAVLAVLKAGAAYVPLDPDYPAERLAFMAGDAGLARLVIDEGTRPVAGPAVTRVDLTAEREAIDAQPGTDPAVRVEPAAPAYLVYTSGSTGRPRGVVVSHGNLAHALAGWRSAWALAPGEAHLQMASAAFDVFTGDWVRALGTGGRLVLCPREVLLDPPALLALLRSARIAVAEFVPAVIRLLLEHCRERGEGLPPLRLLIVGSDTWYGSELESLRRAAAPGTRLINSYGVAEATIDSTWFEAGDSPVPGPVPIGAPFAGVSAYVLDGRGELVPRGVPGELCIGGGGVALGYWNDPALTAQKFSPDPWCRPPGGRLYRTGDRARWTKSGQLELLGRQDDQFKLRGFRIEPAEIEACLVALPGVAAAAVALQSPAPADARLLAFVVPADPAGGTPAEACRLQQLLRQRLPEQLVPGAVVWLSSLPLTPNGKLDRQALASLPGAVPVGAPLGATLSSDEQVVAPKGAPTGVETETGSDAEATICRLFATVLGRDAVDLDEDFFRAGGHSLLATRLVARLRDAFHRQVPLRAIFEAPTPRGLARVIAGPADGSVAAQAGAPPRRRERLAGEPLPLSLMQQRLWFLERLQPGTATYHLHWLLRLRGPLDRGALQSAVDALVARHEVLRTAVVERAGVPAQLVRPRLTVPIDTTPAPVGALIARPFDLASAPLLRVCLLAEGPEDHRLLIVMHHLIADGWSFSVISRELAALYRAARGGASGALPELALQYADYALWQQDQAATAAFARQLAYWREALAGAPPILQLTAPAPAAGAAGPDGAWEECSVPTGTLAALRDLAATERCTLFMVLLAAADALLGRLAGVDDVLVGTPVAGRSHPALEDLVGFFVNTLVLRTGLNGDPPFRELLGRVRHTTLQAFEHADVPFEKLVEVLKPPRFLGHSPLVQVQFALHNQPRQPLDLDGLQVEAETVPGRVVKFDLNLHAAEEGGVLHLALGYRSQVYSATAARGFLEHFVSLLRDVAAAPDQRLSALLHGVPPGLPRAPDSPPAPAAPAGTGIGIAAAPSASATATEVALRDLWAALLGQPSPGLDDDFFAVGGHSLLATRLVAAIADRLGVDLPLVAVFEAPTIRGLARRMAARDSRTVSGAIPRLPRRPDPDDAA